MRKILRTISKAYKRNQVDENQTNIKEIRNLQEKLFLLSIYLIGETTNLGIALFEILLSTGQSDVELLDSGGVLFNSTLSVHVSLIRNILQGLRCTNDNSIFVYINRPSLKF